MKKILTLLLALVLLLGNLTYVYAKGDEPASWAEEAITYMTSNGAVPEKLLNNYKSEITRKEFAALIVQLIESKLNITLEYDSNVFSDTNDIAINKAYAHKIVNGVGNKEFDPEGLITREQIAIMFVNTLKALDILEPSKEHIVYATENPNFKDTSLISDWALSSTNLAFNNSIISGIGDNKFNPKGSATREVAIVIAYRVWINLEDNTFIPMLKEKFLGRIDVGDVKSDDAEIPIEVANSLVGIESEKSSNVGLEKALAERFEYNGRYYPIAYWEGKSYEEAKERFIGNYEKLFEYEPYFLPLYFEKYLASIRFDEILYNTITKDIIQQAPILRVEDGYSVKQVKERQLEQLLILHKWFALNLELGTPIDFTEEGVSSLSLYEGYPILTAGHSVMFDVKQIDDRFPGFRELYSKEPDAKYYIEPVMWKEEMIAINNQLITNGITFNEWFKSTNMKMLGNNQAFARIYSYITRQLGIDTVSMRPKVYAWNIVRFADGSILHICDVFARNTGGQLLFLSSTRHGGDSSVGELIRDGYVTDIEVSNERLTKLLGYIYDEDEEFRAFEIAGLVNYFDWFRNSETVPVGSAEKVFETEAKWNKWYDIFKLDEEDLKALNN